MSEPRTFASLSSGLLARKGAAKPAMRPQGFGQMGMGLEDLGWNDMGHAPQPAVAPTPYHEGARERVPSNIAALTPASGPIATESESPVVEQQRAIAESFAADEDDEAEAEAVAPVPAVKARKKVIEAKEPADVVELPRRPRQSPGARGKAAFTLRLDPERHLKLRLACAVTHRSAQRIVTDALDEFLSSLPELETIAETLPAKAAKRS